MAASSAAEREMNLTALQQRDPYITGIADSATQVAVYSFNSSLNEWEKTNVEGTLFVYNRSAFPINGFMIINRLHLNDLIEPINKNLEFQLQDPFLLYRNARAAIFGIWFYDRDECARIGQLMNSLVQVAVDTQQKESATGRQRRASESDTPNDVRSVADAAKASDGVQKNVDILQMLSKAQDEYDKSKNQATRKSGVSGVANSCASTSRANDASPLMKVRAGQSGKQPPNPSPLLDDSVVTLNSRGSRNAKPVAFKGNDSNSTSHDMRYTNQSGATGGAPDSTNLSTTQISLETLFKRASMNQEGTAEQAKQSLQTGIPLLQNIISNQFTTMVEEIEREHRGGSTARNLPPRSQASAVLTNGPSCLDQLSGGTAEPESPNTAIRRTLNIPPPAIKMNHMQTQQHVQTRSTQPDNVFPTPDVIDRPSFNTCDAIRTRVSPAMTANLQDGVSASVLFQVASVPSPPVTTNSGPDLMRQISYGSGQAVGGSVLPNLSSGGLGRVIPIPVEQLTTPETYLSTAMKNDLSNPGSFLLSPMVFQSSTLNKLPHEISYGEPMETRFMQSRTPVLTSDGPQSSPISPLTKDQLLQAIVHLMKTDTGFLSKVHEAYIATLNLGNRPTKP